MKALTTKYAAAALLIALMAAPALGAAEVSSQSYPDGSSPSGSLREQWIRGYPQQSSDLRQKISELPGTADPNVYMPVLFGVEVKDILPNFGDPRGNGSRAHEGEDIMAVKGTPVVSPTPAVVLQTVTGPDEGNAVYTANPGGETFVYIHLDRFGEGVASGLVLAPGALIGYVGNTGNAAGGPAHLHFEIHNSFGASVDPFPRLTGDFSLQARMSYLSKILAQTSDSVALSRLLITNFKSAFTAALAANITLPLPISDALAFKPANPVSVIAGIALPAGDLALGSSGAAVVTLQKYLIQVAVGPAAAELKNTGATGYFWQVTKAALTEYQLAILISPPNGYYGPATRAFILSHPIAMASSEPFVGSSPSATVKPAALARDLKINMSGEDVRTLQKLLNADGFTVGSTSLDPTGRPQAGSPGNETIFFGPATKAAVIKFQVARDISPAAGYVGPLTRAALASI